MRGQEQDNTGETMRIGWIVSDGRVEQRMELRGCSEDKESRMRVQKMEREEGQ